MRSYQWRGTLGKTHRGTCKHVTGKNPDRLGKASGLDSEHPKKTFTVYHEILQSGPLPVLNPKTQTCIYTLDSNHH